MRERRAGATLTIDLAAIAANYRSLRAKLQHGACAAVVKADAYGLGADRVAPVLHEAGCRYFFAAHLDEGLALRAALPADATICILNGLPPSTEDECAAAGLIPVLNSIEQVEAWAALARWRERALPGILQIDTGMSRLGLPPEDTEYLASKPGLLQPITLQYVMSHLACADEPAHPANREQRERFETLRRLLPAAPASLANSSGIFLGTDYHFDLVRPGAALYGLAPNAKIPNPMRPVIRLDAKVIQIRSIPAGAAVGYGYGFRAAAPMRIATISVGYADGWLRSLGNKGAAYHGTARLPIAGQVSMDSMTVDVTSLPEGALRPGDTVELIGPHQPADDVARACGTIGYEILTSLGRRYHRRYAGL